MTRHTLVVGLLLAFLPCAYGAHSGERYATYRIHTNTLERHASGLPLPHAAKPMKLKQPKAPKAKTHNEHARNMDRVMRQLGYYGK